MRKKKVSKTALERVEKLEQRVEDLKKRIEMLEPKEINVDEWFSPECLGCDG